MGAKHDAPHVRFDRLWIPEPNTGCWLWLGSWRKGGMPFNAGRSVTQAHVYAYERMYGWYPKRTILRRTCKTDRCINPEHRNLLHCEIVVERSRIFRRNKSKEYRQRWRDLLDHFKSGPCSDCGRKFPSVCMDFDHRDPSTKTYAIGDMNYSMRKAFLEEVKKCDLVCSNCHRIRTAIRLKVIDGS